MKFNEKVVKALLSVGAYNKEALEAFDRVDVQADSVSALQILEALNSTRISKLSVFKDMVWDFNQDNPNASRLLRGTRLKIDFGRYTNIPSSVILELKCVAFLYIKVPGFFKDALDKKPTKALKPQTSAVHIDQGLKFVEQLYVVLREELGDFYINTTMQSLSSVPSHYYRTAAELYPFAYLSSMDIFFRAVQCPGLQGTLFPNAVPTVIFDNLPWLRLSAEKSGAPEGGVEKPNKFLRNDLFEHATSTASMVIVDFLDALGEDVVDKDSLRIRNARSFYQSSDNSLSLDKLNAYACYKLFRAGYPVETYRCLWPEHFRPLEDVLKNTGYGHIRNEIGRMLNSKLDAEFRDYLNYVSYSCMYIVAQYTGMRPGELVRLMGETCLEQDDQTGLWLIAGLVEKHQEILTGIFDDYWIAIPIVRDAIRASALLSKLKANPYIFSRTYTVQYGEEALPFSGQGFDHPMYKFFKGFLSEEEVVQIGFFPYMLRHTLAYQMERAGLGLPFISHQLKHFGELVGQPAIGKSFSKTTLSYGEIGETLSKGGRSSSENSLKREAEIEFLKSSYDPDGNYTGPLAAEHKAAMQKEFAGYMAAGYSKDEVFEFMADQHIAVVNVGSALCYGKKNESFDPSLPCIGGLRCNPSRCKEAVVTEAHAPAWKNVYEQNKRSLSDPRFEHSHEHYKAAMEEARMVLLNLGIEVEE